MKKLILLSLSFFVFSAYGQTVKENSLSTVDKNRVKLQISNLLDSLNSSAAKANYKSYFSLYSSQAVFTGTDATERWENDAFKIWAKPIFDKGKAWSFTTLERNIYIDSSGQFAWFDELLSTQMKICRGSGVLVKENNLWKIKQYILSATIPNEEMDAVVKIKTPIENLIIKKLSNK